METKIQKQFIDDGFGFPVHLLNVPMSKVRGHWTPNVNYVELSSLVLKALVEKPAKLTGSELKFIRQSLGMNLTEFASIFYVSHAAVLKWEKAESEATKMKWATEKDIRLFAYKQVEGEIAFYKIYENPRPEAPTKKANTRIDIAKCKAVPA